MGPCVRRDDPLRDCAKPRPSSHGLQTLFRRAALDGQLKFVEQFASDRKRRQYPPFWRDKSKVQYNLGVVEIRPGFWLILPVRAKYIRPGRSGDLDLEKARFR